METFALAGMAVLSLALATMLLFLVGEACWDKVEELRARRLIKRINKDFQGINILSERLEKQRKTQIRHIKERDAADQDILDRAEEYRGDFDRDN